MRRQEQFYRKNRKEQLIFGVGEEVGGLHKLTSRIKGTREDSDVKNSAE